MNALFENLEIPEASPRSFATMKLTARKTDNGFVFVPETWTKELKPIKKANWKHDDFTPHGGACAYELRKGIALVFPGQHQGVIHAAHLYAVTKEMGVSQAKGTITAEGIVFEKTSDDGLRFTTLLKWQSIKGNDPRRVELV